MNSIEITLLVIHCTLTFINLVLIVRLLIGYRRIERIRHAVLKERYKRQAWGEVVESYIGRERGNLKNFDCWWYSHVPGSIPQNLSNTSIYRHQSLRSQGDYDPFNQMHERKKYK